MSERGRTELTNNYDEERLKDISRSLQWRTDGILISPSDYSFLREQIDYWKEQVRAYGANERILKDRLDDMVADRMRMMLERNDARWIARKLWDWARAAISEDMDRVWDEMPEWMKRGLGDD